MRRAIINLEKTPSNLLLRRCMSPRFIKDLFDIKPQYVRILCTCSNSHVRYFTTNVISEVGIDEKLKRKKKTKHKNSKQKTKSEVSRRNDATYTIPTTPGEKKDTKCSLPDAYSPSYVEAAWYPWWEKMGFFNPDNSSQENAIELNASSKYFSMCLPPPNVTGTLHLGHALGNSIQDAIARWHRMCGHKTLWNPGCDHAGIATQVVVEKELWRSRRRTRHDLGRDAFIEEVWKWKNEKGDKIYEQMKQLGSSLDWSRACFTLDPKLSHAVTEAFVRLHDQGLIFRSNRIVHWSCALKSTISDAEVEEQFLAGRTPLSIPGYDEQVTFGILTFFAYPVENSEEKIIVSTTRPETMLGDVAVAVHPDDSRFSHLHGKCVTHPLTKKRMPIILDNSVKMGFGTGAVKITPAHDYKDYEIACRHGLNICEVINDEGSMINVPQPFLGMKRYLAREAVLAALTDLCLLGETKDHPMTIPICSRSQDVIEPRLKEQWFLDCKEMAQRAAEAVKDKRLVLIPDTYEKQWFDRLERIKDWCISRQLWWGHRIPAYKVIHGSGQSAGENNLWYSAHSEEEAMMKASKDLGLPTEEIAVLQDEDVLDTWFSSALFPFSIFGWPDKTTDLQQFYPTTMLETASDILFVWVIRMVMLGDKLTGQLPFNKVLLHKIIRDRHGRKMSKSLGNVIDPLDVICGSSLEALQEKIKQSNLPESEISQALKAQRQDYPAGIPQCGADALRFTLCSYNFTGTVAPVSQDDEWEEKYRKLLFVKNLPLDMNEDKLRNAVPGVQNVKMGKDGNFAYLEFESEDQVDAQFKLLQESCSWADNLVVDYVGEKSLHEPLSRKHWGTGYSVNVDVQEIEANRRFCNKVWQAFRFCQNCWPKDYMPIPPHCLGSNQSHTDLWILSRLSHLVSECHNKFETHDLDKITVALKTFWKEEFCDVYLEYCKLVLRSQDATRVLSVHALLYACMHTALRCSSPFMPFLTEELFQRLPKAVGDHMPSICVAPYPQPDQYSWRNEEVEKEMALVQEAVSCALATRDTFLLTKSRADVCIVCQDEAVAGALQNHKEALVTLSRSASVSVTTGSAPSGDFFSTNISDSSVLFMDLKNKVDEELVNKMIARKRKLEDSYAKTLNEAATDPSMENKVKVHHADLERVEKAIRTIQDLKLHH